MSTRPAGRVAAEALDINRLPGLLDEARTRFGRNKVTLDLYSEPTAADRMAIQELSFNWSRNFYYLTHVGPRGHRSRLSAHVRLQCVGAANFPVLATVIWQSFSARLRPPTFAAIKRELDRQRANLPYLDRPHRLRRLRPVGANSGYYDRDLCLVRLLGVIASSPGRYISTLLLRAFVMEAGLSRWIVIDTTHDNIGSLRLYRREGFTDNVLTRYQYWER